MSQLDHKEKRDEEVDATTKWRECSGGKRTKENMKH